MSKIARIVGQIAAVVATVAGIAAMLIPGGQVLGVALLTIAGVASAVSAVSMAVAQATAKPPDMKGSLNQVMIGANMPVIYSIGLTFVAGLMVYDDSNGTNNVDRTQIMVGSVGGPIESFESFQADFATIPCSLTAGGRIEGKATDSWYGADDGYLWVNSRRGLLPDTALTPFAGRAAFRDWGSANKLSGMACWSATMEFDEKGKRWSGGIPAFGMIGKWARVYDPRLDSTYPGGSGTQRWADEATWTWSENPALHALAYARGRFANDIRVVGIGYRADQIKLARFVEFANLCDANGWKVGGSLFEAPGGSKWNNLKLICQAGAARPVWSGGLLDLKLSKPVVALDTVTRDDLVGPVKVPAMKSWRDRKNIIVPRFRSPDHRWDYVQSDAVTNATYVTEDGEEKTDERQYDMVQWKDQAAQLAAYDLVNEREFGPIELTCKPRLRPYRIGEALDLDLASLLDDPDLATQPAVIIGRTPDPATGTVTLVLDSETAAKHVWALTQTGTAPPTPTIRAPGDVDQIVSTLTETPEKVTALILSSSIEGLNFSIDATGAATISAHSRIYADKVVSVNSGSTAAPVGAVAGNVIAILYRDPARAGGAVTYEAVLLTSGDETPKPSPSDPYLHPVALGLVPATGTTDGGTPVDSGGGGGGGHGGWDLGDNR